MKVEEIVALEAEVRKIIERELSMKNYDYWENFKRKRELIEIQRYEKPGQLTE